MSKRPKRRGGEKIPASVLLTSIITAVVILAICGAVFAIAFSGVAGGIN